MIPRIFKGQKTETGFTLVELLVVIIIIGIITAVAIPAFANQRQRATDAATISDVKNLALLAEEAMIECPTANVFDIHFVSTTISWTKPDGTVVGPFATPHTMTYDYWLANQDTRIRVYDDATPSKSCSPRGIRLSPGTNVHLSQVPGRPRGEFLVYGWNSAGKKYNGSTVNMVGNVNDFPASWRTSVVTYDTRSGGIKK